MGWRAISASVLIAASAAGCGALATHRGLPYDGMSSRRVPPPSSRRPPTAHIETIGLSVKHRPLRAVTLGDPTAPRPVLVVGDIHGNEPAGIAIADWLIGHRQAGEPPLWVIPDLNPDGVAAGTRQNARGVDLNRNFPYHWAPLYQRGFLEWQGPRPLSEPETRAASQFILRLRPRVTIWFHQHQDLVDLSGGDPAIERRFATLVGLPVQQLTRYPGSATGWENHVLPGSTAFVVELPGGRLSPAAVRRFGHAVLALARRG